MTSRRARLAGALLVILTSALAVTAAGSSQAASPPPAHFGIRLLQVPASEANDPRARLYIIDRLARARRSTASSRSPTRAASR
jgi:hypothetical protein